MAAAATAHHVAVVGAGPAGCYAAQALLRADRELRVTMLERLPVPFGLVRYGVAADHPGTKAVTGQFDRVLDDPRVRLLGDVELGRDIDLDELRERYDAVVLATGAAAPRTPALPSAAPEALPAPRQAAPLLLALNSHPEHEPAALGAEVLVLGAGNVAFDLVRLLTRPTGALAGTDIDLDAHRRLAGGVRAVTVLSRSLATAGRFDPQMVRELVDSPGLRLRTIGLDAERDAAGDDPRIRALAEAEAATADRDGPQVVIVFGADLADVAHDGGRWRLAIDSPEGRLELGGDDLVLAAGFETPAGELPDGVDVVGWAEAGWSGNIPGCRLQARALAGRVAERLAATPARHAPDADLLPELAARAVDVAGWRRIDAAERAAAPAGAPRRKLRELDALRAAARAAHDHALGKDVPS